MNTLSAGPLRVLVGSGCWSAQGVQILTQRFMLGLHSHWKAVAPKKVNALLSKLVQHCLPTLKLTVDIM